MNTSDRLAAVETYIADIVEQFSSGHAKEHAYRPALKTLMNAFEDIVAVNDPKRSEHGNPDFIFLKKSNQKIIRGYAEAKDIDVSLDKTEKTNQMERYGGYANLFLTDYLEFRFFKNGEKYKTISLGHVYQGELKFLAQNSEELAREIEAFLELPPEKIKSGRRLAEIMGGKARRIRDNVAHYLLDQSEKNDELENMYKMMRELLVHDLSREKFADMYAQTLVYGLFVARYGDKSPENFDRSEARDLVPKSNPFLRHFFDHIVGPNFDTRLGYIVDELCEVFSVSDVQDIVHKHLRIADTTTDAKDPIIHFYEDFLNEYDPAERKRMGAYYTPIPVVRFIVRQVDKILKEEFGITKGLADSSTFKRTVDMGQEIDYIKKQSTGREVKSKSRFIEKDFHRVQILDPAVGTATFLNETIKYIHEEFKGQEGRWPAYVKDNLIKRLHGFELMMAPYTIAHLKLGMTLRETGVDDLDERLGVYLTNTLEEGIPMQPDLFSFGLAEAVSDESSHAAEIKSERPIMVVMGNPPYSVSSNNKSEYINNLLKDYKKDLNERNIQPLSDDYIKFIRFAEDMISKNGEGVVAMITNNSYLDGSIHRQMRKNLLETFNKIYVVDLHGNSKKKETARDGSKDENVFDIMQGVSIVLMVKTKQVNSGKFAIVYHDEFLGLRKDKFKSLLEFQSPENRIETQAPNYFFVPKDFKYQDKYNTFIPLDKLFRVKSTGVTTHRDSFVIGFTDEEVQNKIKGFFNSDDCMGYLDNLNVNTTGWEPEKIHSNEYIKDNVAPISYKPFDIRKIYYSDDFVTRSRRKTMHHMLQDNIGIVTCRSQNYQTIASMSNAIVDTRYYSAPGSIGRDYVFPLYLYHDDGTRTANFDQTQLNVLLSDLGPHYYVDSKEDLPGPVDDLVITAVEVMDYVYAVLHSPKFRETYKEFLKIDFPRVPKPTDIAEFFRLVKLGRELRELHLMKSSTIDGYSTTFSIAGSDTVEKVTFISDATSSVSDDTHASSSASDTTGSVCINGTQYFGNVPETAWNFYIGGYQPAQKWLKDRKGRKLSSEDIDHYQRIIKILLETDRIMKEIDLK